MFVLVETSGRCSRYSCNPGIARRYLQMQRLGGHHGGDIWIFRGYDGGKMANLSTAYYHGKEYSGRVRMTQIALADL